MSTGSPPDGRPSRAAGFHLSAVEMPFDWPLAYEPAVAPPSERDEPSIWFVFRRTELLVLEQGTTTLPRAPDAIGLSLAMRRAMYLGRLDGQHCWSAEVTEDVEPPSGFAFRSLRGLFGTMDEGHFALAGRALQLIDWDRTHAYCGRCGTRTESRRDERSRTCPACGLTAYPRLAPAVMCLVRRQGPAGWELLLARSPRFPSGMYSALAGFVEPGESLEACVAREVREEVGVELRNLRYFASQPWPFPHSLMIAFFADWAGGEIRPQPGEIEDAKWFQIADLPQLPAKISIARRLIDAAMGEMQAAPSG